MDPKSIVLRKVQAQTRMNNAISQLTEKIGLNFDMTRFSPSTHFPDVNNLLYAEALADFLEAVDRQTGA